MLERYRQDGIAALADAWRPGRTAKANGAYLTALDTALATTLQALSGLCDVWTSDRLSAYLTEQTGVRSVPMPPAGRGASPDPGEPPRPPRRLLPPALAG